jgi:hypothetical protein
MADYPEDPKQPIEIVLKPGAEVSGFIHDPAGEPIANCAVMLVEIRQEGAARSMTTIITTYSDDEGKYVLKGLLRRGDGPDIALMIRPSFKRSEHMNSTMVQRDIREELTEGQKLQGYDFTVDMSQPVIRVTADPEK